MSRNFISCDDFIFDKNQMIFCMKVFDKETKKYGIEITLQLEDKQQQKLTMLCRSEYARNDTYTRMMLDSGSHWIDDNWSHPLVNWCRRGFQDVEALTDEIRKLKKQIISLKKGKE